MLAQTPRERLLPVGAPISSALIARLAFVIPPQLPAVDAMMRFIIAAGALFLIGMHASGEAKIGVARRLHRINSYDFTSILLVKT